MSKTMTFVQTMGKHLRPAIVLTLLLTIATGLLYPGLVTGLAQLLFPHQANGSLITDSKGNVIGSKLIGQYWTSPKYFHGRPSATLSDDGSKAQPYNAENSGPSSLGPTNASLIKSVQERVKALQKENPGVPVPMDLVTSSGSGLDPDISLAAAEFQVPRIASTRGLTRDQVEQVIKDHEQLPWLGIFGEPHVNVLDVNMALDALK